MFNEQQLVKLQKLLNLKETNSAKGFLVRLSNFLKQNNVNQSTLTKGILIILEDLHKQEAIKAKKVKKINLDNVKNPVILKYANKILELSSKGLGVRKIEKYLKTTHNARVSYVTIYNFLKNQKAKNG